MASLLVVTEKMGNRLDTYTVDENGLPSQPIDNPSIGMTPFGFAFEDGGTLVVSEAMGGVMNASAASSYSAVESGLLGVVSGSVANGQTASCWVVITRRGDYTYVSNTASGTVTSYQVNDDNGTLTLLESVAANTGMTSAPIDMALSNNGRFLYVHAAGLQSLVTFKVNSNGTLTMVDSDGGLPLGAQGVAAR